MQKLLLLFLFLSCAHADPIYRWRDAQGKIHYGEAAPPDNSYEKIDEAILPPAHGMPATKSSSQTAKKSRNKTNKPNKPNKRKTSRASKNADATHKRCQRYDEQLENIGNRLRAGYREPTGNRLRAKRRQLEQRVRDEC